MYRLAGLGALGLAALGATWWLRSGSPSNGGSPEAAPAPVSVAAAPAASPAPPSAAAEEGGVTTAEAAPAPVPEPVAPARPFRQVRQIEVLPADGATVLRLSLDGSVDSARVQASRLGFGAPRVLLRLVGVVLPYEPAYMTVKDARLARVRTGLHEETSPAELHVVIDLTGKGVELQSMELEPAAVKLTLVGGGP